MVYKERNTGALVLASAHSELLSEIFLRRIPPYACSPDIISHIVVDFSFSSVSKHVVERSACLSLFIFFNIFIIVLF